MIIFFEIHILHFLNDNTQFTKLHEHSFTWFIIFKFAYTFSITCHVYSIKVMTYLFTTRKHFRYIVLIYKKKPKPHFLKLVNILEMLQFFECTNFFNHTNIIIHYINICLNWPIHFFRICGIF